MSLGYEIAFGVIAVLLFFIWNELSDIRKRLKERFPTDAELDYRLSQDDPSAHYAKHKHEKKR